MLHVEKVNLIHNYLLRVKGMLSICEIRNSSCVCVCERERERERERVSVYVCVCEGLCVCVCVCVLWSGNFETFHFDLEILKLFILMRIPGLFFLHFMLHAILRYNWYIFKNSNYKSETRV